METGKSWASPSLRLGSNCSNSSSAIFLNADGDGSFFNVDLLAGEVFQMLDSRGERLEADRFARCK